MNRIVRAVAVLFVSAMALPLFAADSKNIVDEVIRMQRAGVAEENIIDFIHKSDSRYSISADDVIAMSDAKVSRTIIKAVLDEADDRNGVRDRRESDRERVVVAPRFSAYPYSYWYDPFYDPFWYAPRVSVGFGFGYGGYRGGHFGHHGGGRHGRR